MQSLLGGLLEDYRSDKTLMNDEKMCRILETFTAKLMVANKERQELARFLLRDNSCDLMVLEPDLAHMGCFAALLRLRQYQHDHAGTLELYTRLLDEDLRDDTFDGTLSDFIRILESCPEDDLVHKYSLWLVQRDAEAGIRLLTRDRSSTYRNQNSLLQELRGIDQRAADGYLEYMALSRKQHTSEAHTELAQVLIDRILHLLGTEEARQSMAKVTQDYSSGGFAESFVAHMALYCHQSPLIVLRLKLIMLLQGSSLLDQFKAADQVREEPLLLFEQAILAGKLSHDEEALILLAIELRDANSAEIYCNQNRFALSPIQMQSLAQEQKDLVLYTNFYTKSVKRATRTDKVKLLKLLLRVYMQKGGEGGFEVATSHLLNSQSLNLSASEVLEMVPSHWSLSALETFLSRSLRKEMHRMNEGQIQRSIALAQNLEVAETLWAQRRNLGGVIEDGEGGGDYEGRSEEEEVPVAVDIVGEKFAAEKEPTEVFL